MIFRVAADLFRPGGARAADLIALLRNAAVRDHTLWVVEDPAGTEIVESVVFDAWMERLQPPLREEIRWVREALRRLRPHAVTRGAVVIAVGERPAAPRWTWLDLGSAIRLASMPLLLMVEDGLSDAAFLRCVMPPRWRKKLDEWERDGVIRFEHGGGVSGMKRLVQYIASGHSPDPLGLGAEAWKAAHFLICDRDTQENGKLGSGAAQLSSELHRHNMQSRLHILKRHSQESYLPPEILRKLVEERTSSESQDEMRKHLHQHLALKDDKRHQRKLPKLSGNDWFKNVFLKAESDWRERCERDGSGDEMHARAKTSSDWREALESDGSGDEMRALAETIAAFI